MRNFSLKIKDTDGEYQEYLIQAPSAWKAIELVTRTFERRKDFYGHIPSDTVNVEVSELVSDAEMTGALIYSR